MSAPNDPTPPRPPNEFERHADAPRPSLAREFLWFVMDNKKWWLIPLLLVLLLFTLLIALGSTGAAPFIYTLF